MNASDVLEALRTDVYVVERDHHADDTGSYCVLCETSHPCRALACATWLRRLVLERV